MRNPNDILINLRKHSNESTYQYLRLYRNLFNEQMFYAAYQRIYAKPGNMTSSTDGRTIDQMTLQRIDDIIKTLKYVRYADDFLIGVAGSKADCEKIKADITQFMREKLRLELSAEKTLIINAQDKAKFLGYEIYARKSDALKRNNKGVLRRSHNARVVLELPKEAVKKKLLEYGAMVIKDNGTPSGEWWSNPRRKLINQKPEEILALINGEIRGFYNYYSIAHNIGN